ncbi:MAG TPA: IclR family transcriptional regulator, partial [Candidatus Aerophobetes bacterium]|nr:IclR family transcriptional regulator [Candidatus Aerophobetes bacterium]
FRKFRFVEQDGENKKYRLGLRLLELGNVVQSQLDIRRIAFPYLKKLNRETNETAYLVVLAEKRIVYVDCVESTARLRVRPLFGERVPLHCTSLGKAIMAFLPEYEVERIIKEEGLTRFTSNTITDPGLLKKELELIRERGYAIDNMEHEEGIRCVGASIRNSRGEVFAAISLSGPSQRLSFERIRKIAPLVIQAAREISAKMGYSG